MLPLPSRSRRSQPQPQALPMTQLPASGHASGQAAGRGRRLLEVAGAAAIAGHVHLPCPHPARGHRQRPGQLLGARGPRRLPARRRAADPCRAAGASHVHPGPDSRGAGPERGPRPNHGRHRPAVLLRCDRHRPDRRPGRPAAGAATGALSSIVWSFFNPTVLPFAAGAALIGFLAGLAARSGLFRRFYLAPVAGFVTGILAGVVSAPIAAFVFGGTSGRRAPERSSSAFRAMGDTLLAAITKQALISDPWTRRSCSPSPRCWSTPCRAAPPSSSLRPAVPGARRQGPGQAEAWPGACTVPPCRPALLPLHPLTALPRPAAPRSSRRRRPAGRSRWRSAGGGAAGRACRGGPPPGAGRGGDPGAVLVVPADAARPVLPRGPDRPGGMGTGPGHRGGTWLRAGAGTRTAACVLVFLLFSFTVSVPDLVAALTARRVPRQFSFVLASTLTLLPAIAGGWTGSGRRRKPAGWWSAAACCPGLAASGCRWCRWCLR